MKSIIISLVFVLAIMTGASLGWTQGARPMTDEQFRQFLQKNGGKPTDEFKEYVEFQRQQEVLQEQIIQYLQQPQQTQQGLPSSSSQDSNATFMNQEVGRTDFMRSLNNHRLNMTEIYRRPYK